MPVPFTDSAVSLQYASRLGIPLAALIAAILGSGHCLAMCGGIATAAGTKVRQTLAYQLGRLFSYLLVGVLAGTLGGKVLATAWRSPLGLFAALLSSLVLILVGASLWRIEGSLHLSWAARWNPMLRLWAALSSSLRGQASRAALLGILTPLLPCGWLYGFVLLATTSGGAFSGALVMAALWVGSLPSLAMGPALIQWLGPRFSSPQRKIVATILILFGAFNLANHLHAGMQMAKGEPVTAHCHHHPE